MAKKDYEKLLIAERAVNPETTDSYANMIDNAIENVHRADYDFDAGQLYKDYKKTYMTEAEKAKNNVIESGKTLTAGYPDTYVESAANQQNQLFLADINRLAPAFDNLDWARRMQAKEDAIRQAQMAGELSDIEYGRQRDAINDDYKFRDYMSDAYKYTLGKEADLRALKQDKRAADQKYILQVYNDYINELEKEVSELEAATKGSRGSGGSGGGGGGDGSYYDYGEYTPTETPKEDYIINSTGENYGKGRGVTPINTGAWIYISGLGRFSIEEVKRMVDRGEVREYTDGKGGHYYEAVKKKTTATKSMPQNGVEQWRQNSRNLLEYSLAKNKR